MNQNKLSDIALETTLFCWYFFFQKMDWNRTYIIKKASRNCTFWCIEVWCRLSNYVVTVQIAQNVLPSKEAWAKTEFLAHRTHFLSNYCHTWHKYTSQSRETICFFMCYQHSNDLQDISKYRLQNFKSGQFVMICKFL